MSVGCFEQGLLGADVERRDLGDRIDQHFVVEPADRGPVDRQAQSVAEALRVALDLGPLEQRQRRRVAVVERLDVDLGAAIGRVDLGLADQAETVRSQQHDVEAAVVEFLDPDNVADASDLVQRRIVIVEIERLDHPDLPRALDRVLDHLAVARLEDMQRQLARGNRIAPASGKIGTLSLRLM